MLPVAQNGMVSGKRNSDIASNLPVATDADGDTLIYKLKTRATNGVVTVNTDGKFVYKPVHDFVGTDHFTYQVDDGHGGTATATMTITVTHVSTPPVAYNGTVEGKKNIDIIGKLPKAIDADGYPLTYTVNKDATNGLVTVDAAGKFVYKPVHDFVGTDQFTYQVDDGHGGKATAIVRVKLTDDHGHGTPVPGSLLPSGSDSCDDSSDDGSSSYDSPHAAFSVSIPPVAQNGMVSGKKNLDIAGNLPLATDADGGKLTYSVKTHSTQGTVVVEADGKFTYKPHHNFIGEDRFTYQVSDSRGGIATAIVKVKVTDGGHHEH